MITMGISFKRIGTYISNKVDTKIEAMKEAQRRAALEAKALGDARHQERINSAPLIAQAETKIRLKEVGKAVTKPSGFWDGVQQFGQKQTDSLQWGNVNPDNLTWGNVKPDNLTWGNATITNPFGQPPSKRKAEKKHGHKKIQSANAIRKRKSITINL